MTYKTLSLNKDGHKAIVTLNRPELLNAISLDMWDAVLGVPHAD